MPTEAPEMIETVEDNESSRFLVSASIARDTDGLHISFELDDAVSEMMEYLAESETVDIGWGDCWAIEQPESVTVTGETAMLRPQDVDADNFFRNGNINLAWLTIVNEDDRDIVFEHPVDSQTFNKIDDILDGAIKGLAKKHLVRTEMETTIRQVI